MSISILWVIWTIGVVMFCSGVTPLWKKRMWFEESYGLVTVTVGFFYCSYASTFLDPHALNPFCNVVFKIPCIPTFFFPNWEYSFTLMWVTLKLVGGIHQPSALMEFEIQFYPVCGLVVAHSCPHCCTPWCRSVLRMRGPPSLTAKCLFHKDKCHSETGELVINSKSCVWQTVNTWI